MKKLLFILISIMLAQAASAQINRKNPEDFPNDKPVLTDNIYSQTGGPSFKFTLSQLDSLLVNHGTAGPKAIGIACSDLTTDLATGTTKAYFRIPYDMVVTEVRASVLTAPVGDTIKIDINEGGTTILGPKLIIDPGEKTSTTASVEYAISDTTLADDAEITVDIDKVGSTTKGKGLIIWLIGK